MTSVGNWHAQNGVVAAIDVYPPLGMEASCGSFVKDAPPVTAVAFYFRELANAWRDLDLAIEGDMFVVHDGD